MVYLANAGFRPGGATHHLQDVSQQPPHRRPGSSLFFQPLTGLRAPLMLWVVHHNFFYERPFTEPGFIKSFLGNGYISVSLFFQLSGFLGTITDRREQGGGALILKRLRRLYPAFWISVGLGVLAEQLAGRGRPWDARNCSSLLTVLAAGHAWLPSLIFDDGYNGPSWSVSCEIFFIVAFVFCRPYLYLVSGRRAGLITLLALFAALLGTAFAFRALDMHNSQVKFNPLVRLPQFLAGCVLGRMRALGMLDVLRPHCSLAASACALALILAAGLAPPFALNPLYPFYISGLLDPLIALLIVSLSLEPASPDPAADSFRRRSGALGLHRLLCWQPLRWLGERSFALYLLQSPVHRLVRALCGFEGEAVAGALFWGVYWAALLLGGLALFHFVEDACRLKVARPPPKIAPDFAV